MCLYHYFFVLSIYSLAAEYYHYSIQARLSDYYTLTSIIQTNLKSSETALIQFCFISACYGCCCPMCMVCTNAKDMGENLGMFCCLSYFCFPCSVFLLRKKAREMYGIEVIIFNLQLHYLAITFIPLNWLNKNYASFKPLYKNKFLKNKLKCIMTRT